MTAIVTCSTPYFANRALEHIGVQVQHGRKKKDRAGSPYEFFGAHGIKVIVSSSDGIPIPEHIIESMTKQVEVPPPPAKGNGKYQRTGLVPATITDYSERRRAIYRVKRDKKKAKETEMTREPIRLELGDNVSVEAVVSESDYGNPPKSPTVVRGWAHFL